MPWEPLPGTPGQPEAMSTSLERVLRSLGGPAVDVVQQVFEEWPRLAGPELGAVTTPEALRDGRLVVAVADPAWAAEVGFRRASLLDRLAGELGEGVVTAVEVRVRPPRR
jgi:predicted nucleic acid-binding Zn ribbon protein